VTLTARPVSLVPAHPAGRSGWTPLRSSTSSWRRARLGLATLMSLGLLLIASACGMDVQTNNPYTPADGVNLDVGTVHVRNLTVVSRAKGEGYLAGSMVSAEPEALLAVSGQPIKVDGSPGAEFTGTLPSPVALGNGTLVVLTSRPLITLKSADLMPGGTTTLTLQFSKAGEVTISTTVVDGMSAQYETISPTPSAPAS